MLVLAPHRTPKQTIYLVLSQQFCPSTAIDFVLSQQPILSYHNSWFLSYYIYILSYMNYIYPITTVDFVLLQHWFCPITAVHFVLLQQWILSLLQQFILSYYNTRSLAYHNCVSSSTTAVFIQSQPFCNTCQVCFGLLSPSYCAMVTTVYADIELLLYYILIKTMNTNYIL